MVEMTLKLANHGDTKACKKKDIGDGVFDPNSDHVIDSAHLSRAPLPLPFTVAA
jgi:hypothetical protein